MVQSALSTVGYGNANAKAFASVDAYFCKCGVMFGHFASNESQFEKIFAGHLQLINRLIKSFD
jgi:hypothetical protein